MTDVKVMTNEDIKDEAKIQQEKDLKALMDTIVQLKQLEGLNIDLLGSWLWIGGNTKANKEALKALGCRWASKKKLWYWHCESESIPPGQNNNPRRNQKPSSLIFAGCLLVQISRQNGNIKKFSR